MFHRTSTFRRFKREQLSVVKIISSQKASQKDNLTANERRNNLAELEFWFSKLFGLSMLAISPLRFFPTFSSHNTPRPPDKVCMA